MTPISEKCFFNSPGLEGFFQDGEESQRSTRQKSSQVAMAALSSPFQKEAEGILSDSLDFSDYAFSPSDFPSDLSYYEQGACSLEDLFVESTGYKRKGSPSEPLEAKRIRFSELEDSQNSTSFFEIQAEPFEGEPKSISQLDELYQMIHPSEVLGQSREEWMSDSLDSHKGFMEQQWAHEGEAVGFQENLRLNEKESHEEIGNGAIFFEPSESVLVPRTMTDEKIVEFACECHAMEEKLTTQHVKISETSIHNSLKAKDLHTFEKRKQAAKPLQIQDQTLTYSSVLELRAGLFVDSDVERKVVELACQNCFLSRLQIQNELKKEKIDLPVKLIRNILDRQGLNTREKRKQAARALSIQDPSYCEQASFSLEDLHEETGERSIFSELPESIEKQTESSERPKDSRVEKPQMGDVTVFDEEKIGHNDRIVLNAMHENPEWGAQKLYKELKELGITTISLRTVKHILDKYDLGNVEKRDKAFQAGWPRFKTLPLPMEPPLSIEVIREKVLEFALQNPRLAGHKMGKELSKKSAIKVSCAKVLEILKEKGLETPEKREEAAKKLS
ncbi:MAG: hypothetical protein Q8L98_07985 [Chlamydiales bacterium]|nr:hypothetical protein [Chlamydiales bacterium]